MAFTGLSSKVSHLDLLRKNSNENIGPATYDTDGRMHKELMQALYPKKKAPFNQTEIRESPLNQP